jgi:hypothetical protein
VPVSATAERGGLYEDTSLGQSGQALLAPPAGASVAGAMPTGEALLC